MGKKKNQQNWQNGDDEGQKKLEEKTEENKEEKTNNSGSSNKDVVLKVYMHCEGCANKVFNCLKGFDGVEDIVIDNSNHKVIVKGRNVDSIKVLKRLQKKFSRNVELISPKPKQDNQNKSKKEDQKKQEPKMKSIVLKMYMHCEGCAEDIKRNISKMEGIMCVEPNMEKSSVVIKGLFDSPKLVENITKRLGKHVEILKQGVDEEKEKEKGQKKGIEQEIMVYPSQYHVKYIYPSLLLSDENVFSCSIM